MRKSKTRLTASDKLLNVFVYTFLCVFLVIIVYPLIYVVSSSFSSGLAVSGGRVFLWPVDFTLQGYKLVFSYKQVWTGYRNTIFYTVVGTAINLVMTTLAAYPLSRKNFQGRNIYMTLFLVTMFFGGGLIPTYLLLSQIHFTNTVWALIIPGAINTYNMIIMRTYFQNSIPEELIDAARIDGCNDIGILTKIVIPVSKSIYAVITLYYMVGHWNSYFSGLMYLRNRELYPLQLILRSILNASKIDLTQIQDPAALAAAAGSVDLMKYSLVIVSSLPVLIAYPFVQKYFKKGVMIGSVKG